LLGAIVRSVAKLASITFSSLAFSYWIDYLGFITEGKLADVLITPSLGVPNWSVIYIINTAPSSTAFDCFYWFCRAVIAVFGDIYLRSPTVQDIAQILAFNEARGFPRCLEALTACIGNGRIVRFPGRKCTRVTKNAAL
jgi:hypothetical protein